MRFDNVQFSRDPHQKPVVVEVESGLLVVRREGIAKWTIATVFVGLSAAFLWLVYDIGKPQTVEAVLSWKGLLTVIVFISMFLLTADLLRRCRLHLEFDRNRYFAMASQSPAIVLGLEAIAERVGGEAAPAIDEASTFGVIMEKADRALRLTREERAGVLKTIRELGGREAAEVKRRWEQMGVDTVRKQGDFIRERKVSKAAQACLLLDDENAELELYPRKKRRWTTRDLARPPLLTFNSPADANKCSAIFNTPRIDSPARDSP